MLLKDRAANCDEVDLVLSDAARAALDDILTEHRRADVLRSHGMQPARKLLFCGQPGCGKTMAAETIARALGLPLVGVRVDLLVSPNPEETEANLLKVFDYIDTHSVVALFSEFATLSREHGYDVEGGGGRSISVAMQMMERHHGESILIATTNHENLLKEVIWRRFDEVLRFETPNLEQIKRLLALNLSGVRRSFDLDDDEIASMFKSMSHADIGRVLRRAIKTMILSGSGCLNRGHIGAALAREYRHPGLLVANLLEAEI